MWRGNPLVGDASINGGALQHTQGLGSEPQQKYLEQQKAT